MQWKSVSQHFFSLLYNIWVCTFTKTWHGSISLSVFYIDLKNYRHRVHRTIMSFEHITYYNERSFVSKSFHLNALVLRANVAVARWNDLISLNFLMKQCQLLYHHFDYQKREKMKRDVKLTQNNESRRRKQVLLESFNSRKLPTIACFSSFWWIICDAFVSTHRLQLVLSDDQFRSSTIKPFHPLKGSVTLLMLTIHS